MTEQTDPDARKERLDDRTGARNVANLDARGVMPAEGRRTVEPDDPATLDTDLDTSPRTDGSGGDADQPDVLPPGVVGASTRQVQQTEAPDDPSGAVDDAGPDRRLDD